jgi:hypothetical protein
MARTVTLLPLLLVSACTAPAENQQGSGNETAAPSRSAAVPADARIPARDTAAAVQLALLPPSREGDAATTAGTIQAEGGCLYLRPVAGRRLFIAFTVPGIRWDAGTGALIVPGSNGQAVSGPVIAYASVGRKGARRPCRSFGWRRLPTAATRAASG